MRPYTRKGDQGSTRLSGERGEMSKSSLILDVIGSLDELIAFIGLLRSQVNEDLGLKEEQVNVQNIISEVSGCGGFSEVSDRDTERLESKIDNLGSEVGDLDEFEIPGFSVLEATAHCSRSVCRRAERRLVEFNEEEGVREEILAYINRLSDFLFMIAPHHKNKQGN